MFSISEGPPKLTWIFLRRIKDMGKFYSKDVSTELKNLVVSMLSMMKHRQGRRSTDREAESIHSNATIFQAHISGKKKAAPIGAANR
jgi:hypothetical protein